MVSKIIIGPGPDYHFIDIMSIKSQTGSGLFVILLVVIDPFPNYYGYYDRVINTIIQKNNFYE